MNESEPKIFYRYELNCYGNDDSAPTPDDYKLEITEYQAIKETKCGYWISQKLGKTWLSRKKRWISKDSKSRFAYPYLDEALQNYIARTKRRIQILKYQLDSCQIGLNIAKTAPIAELMKRNK